jgi:hypothetical protein
MNSPDPWRVMQAGSFISPMVLPDPRYGHPFFGHGYPQGWAANTSDAWEAGLERGTNVFVGAEAAQDFSVRADLDDDQVLHGSICIDGRCYQTSINLAPLIAIVMRNIAQYHAGLHDGSAPAPHLAKISGAVPLGAVDRAVGAAADELIGALVEKHYRVAGWWHDLTHGVTAVVNKVGDTIKALKGPISLAAGAAATSFVGPSAAPLASQVTGALSDAAGGDYKAAGKAALAVADKAAANNPQVAQVVNVAKAAFANSAAAHHVAMVAHKASSGDLKSLQQVAQIAKAATQGDSTAQNLISNAQNVAGGQFDLSSLTDALGGIF